MLGWIAEEMEPTIGLEVHIAQKQIAGTLVRTLANQRH